MEVKPHIGVRATTTRPTGTTTLLAANVKRNEVIITNEHASTIYYIKKGLAASVTNYSFRLTAGETAIFDNYCGVLTVNVDPAGNLNVDELT